MDEVVSRSQWLLYDRRSDPHVYVESPTAGSLYVTIAPLQTKRWLYGIVTPEAGVQSELEAGARRDRAVTVVTSAALIAAAVVAARRFAGPISALTERAQALARGEAPGRLGLGRRDEVGRLATAFDVMAAALGEKESQLRRHAAELEAMVEARTAALQVAEARYREMVERSPSVIYAASLLPPYGMHYISPRVEALLGYPVAAWLAEPDLWQRRLHPEDRAPALEARARARTMGDGFQFDYRLIARDSRPVWVHDEAILVRDRASGEPRLQGFWQDITERKTADEAAARRAQELAAVNAIVVAINALTGLESILDAALAQVVTLMGVDGAECYLADETGRLSLAAHCRMDPDFLGGSQGLLFAPGVGIPGHAFSLRRPVCVLDAQTAVRYRNDAAAGRPVYRSLVCVPILGREAPHGVYLLYSQAAREFSPAEQWLLMVVGRQLGVAVERAELFQDVQRNADELAAATEVLQALNATAQVTEAFPTVAKSLRGITDCERASLVLFDEDRQWATVMALDQPHTGMGGGARLRVADSPAAEDLLAGRPHLTPDLAAETSGSGEQALYQAGFRSRVNLPLCVGGQAIGALSLAWRRPAAYRVDQIGRLVQIADSLALAVERARLDEEARRRTQAMLAMYETGVTITSSLDLEEVLRGIYHQISRVMEAPYFLIIWRDEARNELRVEFYLENGQRHDVDYAPVKIEPGSSGPAQWILEHMQPLRVADLWSETILRWEEAEKAGSAYAGRRDITRSYLGVPLVVGGRAVGVLSVQHDAVGVYGPREEELLAIIAAQAGTAISNARLYEETMRSREQLRSLTRQLVSAQEDERRRVSRELHDEAGQALTALNISLNRVKQALPARFAAVRRRIGEGAALVEGTLERIRQLAHELRPPALETMGLSLALESLCREFARRTGLRVDFEAERVSGASSEVSLTLYRCVQEALTNAARHGRASSVRVRMAVGEDGREICVSVEDDGAGFDPEAVLADPARPGGFGLLGMRERLQLVRGRLEIDSRPGEGARLFACVPLEANHDTGAHR